MFKVICSGILLTIGLSLSPLAMAQGATVDCGLGTSQCADVCDGEKRWGLFKGKQFEACAVRCEEQLVRQCTNRNKNTGEYTTGESRDDKVHPQGKEYGYEKNADKVKGQHGAAVSAEHRADGHEHDHGNEMHGDNAHEHEDEHGHADKEQHEVAEKMKKVKAKAKNKSQKDPGSTDKEK